MNRAMRRMSLTVLAVATLTAGVLASGAAAVPQATGATRATGATGATEATGAFNSSGGTPAPTSADVCGAASQGYARCLAKIRTDSGAAPKRVRTAAGMVERPAGYGAGQLRSAYKIPRQGAASTVAVVIAFDVPNAEADLATYRSTFGLAPCTTANGCFRKVNQRGAPAPLPEPDGGWALEGSMDIQMVSAACPSCKILLVTADTNYLDDMAKAAEKAAAMGATVISNSYGAYEWGGMWKYASSYHRPGVVSVASSGDSGFGTAIMPAVLPGVLSVGGTALNTASNGRGWTEDAWWGAGSSCSAYVSKPAHQKDTHCQMRTIADVSAVADPNTGVAVYDSYENPFGLPPGWIVLGGTSASAPLIAGMIGAKGDGATFRPAQVYSRARSFFDVIGGSTGFCGGDYLCTGKKGYDAPTGVGSPNGLAGL